MEHKSYNISELKFSDVETETMTFEGYGAVFDNIDSGGDLIKKGAFSASLAESKAKNKMPSMLFQHGGVLSESMTPIGIWTEISEDNHGLKVKGKLAETPRGREAYELLKMGALQDLSIGYKATDITRGTKSNEPKRTLNRVYLGEISLVVNGMNDKATVHSVKSIKELGTMAEIEDNLRDAGYSRKEAKTLVAKIKGQPLRDADEDLKAAINRNIHSLRGS